MYGNSCGLHVWYLSLHSGNTCGTVISTYLFIRLEMLTQISAGVSRGPLHWGNPTALRDTLIGATRLNGIIFDCGRLRLSQLLPPPTFYNVHFLLFVAFFSSMLPPLLVIIMIPGSHRATCLATERCRLECSCSVVVPCMAGAALLLMLLYGISLL